MFEYVEGARSAAAKIGHITYVARQHKTMPNDGKGPSLVARWSEDRTGRFKVDYELSFPAAEVDRLAGTLAFNGDYFQHLRLGAKLMSVQRHIPKDQTLFSQLDLSLIMAPFRWMTGFEKGDHSRIPLLGSIFGHMADDLARRARPIAVEDSIRATLLRPCAGYIVDCGRDPYSGAEVSCHVYVPADGVGPPLGWDNVDAKGNTVARFRVLEEIAIRIADGEEIRVARRHSIQYNNGTDTRAKVRQDGKIISEITIPEIVSFETSVDSIASSLDKSEEEFHIDPSLAKYIRDVDQGVMISVPGLEN